MLVFRDPTAERCSFMSTKALVVMVFSFTVIGVFPLSIIGDHSTPETAIASSSSDEADSYLYLPLIYNPARYFLPFISQEIFYNPRPANGALNQSLNANLLWQNFLSERTPVGWEIYLEAEDQTPDALVAFAVNPYYDPQTFLPDTQYYWQVVLIDGDGNRITGPVWTFRTDVPFDPSDVDTMVLVPEGEFVMGCDPGNPFGINCAYDIHHYELPLHPVYLDTYEIDKYEVTNVQYRSCVEAGVCNPPKKARSKTRDEYFNHPDYNYYPVLFVSHWDAEDYCEWAGKRLPTEAEWEKAARGTIDTRMWSWGNEDPDCSRLNFNHPGPGWCNGDTTPVGDYLTGASPYGVMNMSGNVFEWVADLYDVGYYLVSPYYNPLGPEVSREVLGGPDSTIPFFTIRGAGYMSDWYYHPVSHRHWGHHADRASKEVGDYDVPLYRNDFVGFRCARSLENE